MAASGSASGRWITRLARAASAIVLVWAGVWIGSGWVYLVDLVVSFQSVAVLGAGVVLVTCAVLRRWGPAAVGAVAVAVGAWPLVHGRDISVGPVDVLSPPAPGVVRVVSFNIGPESPVWEEDMRRVLGWHADVVVLLETPPTLWRMVDRDGGLRGEGTSTVVG